MQDAKQQIHDETAKHVQEVQDRAAAAVATAAATPAPVDPNQNEEHSSYDEKAEVTNTKEHGKKYKHSKYLEKETTQYSEY